AMPWGSYRLVVTDPKSGASASYRFYSGWAANAAADRPDHIPVAADKPSYATGQTAHISIKPGSDGRALVVVAGDRVFSSQLIRAPNDATGREPVRAIGVAWLGIDNAPRTLAVNIGGPKKVLPRQRLNLPVN